MIPTRKRIFILIFLIVTLGLLLRILLFPQPLLVLKVSAWYLRTNADKAFPYAFILSICTTNYKHEKQVCVHEYFDRALDM